MTKHLAQQAHGVQVHLAEGLGGFALGGKYATGLEDAAAVLKEGAVEQPFRRAGRVGAIDDHHVVAGGGGVADPGDAVAHRELQARISPGRTTDRGQVSLAPLHHQPVDLHQVELAYAGMAQALPRRTAVAAADHQHPFDALGAAEGRMHDRLVIVALLALGGHPAAIEQQALAVALAVDDRDPLEGGVLLGDHLAGQAVADPIEHLINPARGGGRLGGGRVGHGLRLLPVDRMPLARQERAGGGVNYS